MMSGLFHLSNLSLGPGMLTLALLSAGAALAVCVILIVAAFRRAGRTEVTNALWGGALVLAGAGLAALLIERSADSGGNGDRRVIERQAADLTARAIAPGSTLACLDVVASAVADGCEKAVFATAEAVAVAVDYIDARVSLLAASTALVDREPSLRPAVERLRGAMEADRFGLVAHVLTTRGCGGADCADLKLLRDPARVLANMTARAFEARVGAYAQVWHANGGTSSPAIPAPPVSALPPVAAVSPAPAMPHPPATSGTSGGSRIDFPSAASIPPVSIMTPEPTTGPTPAAEPRPAPAAKPPVQPRRQSARDQAPPLPAPAPQRPAAQSPQPSQPPQRAATVPLRSVAPAPMRPAAPPPLVQAAPPVPPAAAEPEPPRPDALPSHGAD